MHNKMLFISFMAMFVIMYVAVYQYTDVYFNLNQVYMTCAMASAMFLIELYVMGHNVSTRSYIIGCVIFIVSIMCIRRQIGVKSDDFLRGMIPHHSMAILQTERLLERNDVDENVRKLAERINKSQTCEIRYMKDLLERRGVKYYC